MLLPQAERRGEIHFLVAKSLPYGARVALAFLLMAGGLALQFYLGGMALAGVPVVFAGVLLLLTKGYENKVEQDRSTREWRSARVDEIRRIIALSKAQKKWDQDAVDISNARGVLSFLGIAAVCVVVIFGLSAPLWKYLPVMPPVLALDALVMLAPFWLTGIRSILKNDQLVVKAQMLLKVEEAFGRIGAETGEEFQYQIETMQARDGSGDVPRDVKAILMFHQASPEFLGLQMQISINSVQGKDYPYFYCVLVARPEFGGLPVNPPPKPEKSWLLTFLTGTSAPRGIVVERNREKDVDIAVIRQRTTKKTGYHTNEVAAAKILQFALGEARRILAKQG